MPDTDLLDAPSQSTETMDANAVFASKHNADNPAVQEALSKSKAQSDTVSVDTQNKSGQTVIDKPDAMKPKSKIDALGKINKPEEKKVEQTTNGKEPAKEPNPDNLKEFRQQYDLTKKERDELKAELEKVKPDYEKIRKEFDLTKEELNKLKALNLNGEERQRFDSLRQQHALVELRESKDFKEKILAPIQQRLGKIEAAVSEAKLSPTGAEALKNAMDIQNEFSRDREIRRIFSEVEGITPEDLSLFVSSMSTVGRELNEQFYPRMEQAEAQASEIEKASRQNSKQQAEQAKMKEEQEYKRESEALTKELGDGAFKVLLDDPELSIDGVTFADALKDAELPANARERAYHAKTAQATPFLIQFINKLWSENHSLKSANKARNGASPSLTDGVVKDQAAANAGPSIEEAFGKGRRF